MSNITITSKLMQRFCKDCNLPINLFLMPHFTSRLTLYDKYYNCCQKWSTFLSELDAYDTEQDYFEDYNRIKDAAINDIKATNAYQQFNSTDMNQFAVTHKNLPSKDIFKPSFDGKSFISVDMKKANFSALRNYNPDIFDGAETWTDFLRKYTSNTHILHSKYIRQVILGNCNPKRHITYEKYLMDDILTYLLEVINIDKIVFFSNDEIVFDVSEYNINEREKLLVDLSVITENLDIPLRTELFDLHAIPGTNGYFKDNYQNNTIEFKCLDSHMLPFVIRAINKEPIEPEDKLFIHEGLLSQFVETPKISIPKRRYP